MKPFIETGILAYKGITESRTTPYKRIEVVYCQMNYNDTLHIARMKIMDELYRSYLLS